jgi:anaerobic magnesium-protoporphyrin IX monomethyl ester cyclase
MTHVCFINPPSPFLTSDRGAPPLGILHLAAQLRANDMDASLWDLTGDPELAQALVSDDAKRFSIPGTILRYAIEAYAEQDMPVDLFAITAVSAQYSSALKLLKMLKEGYPRIPVAIGGSHVSTLPYQAIDDGFDLVVAGEADLDFPKYLKTWDLAPGDRMVMNCTAPSDLDALELPARDLIDLGSYCANLTVGEGLSTTVHSSRGCPFTCAYCVRELGDKARIYRVRNPMLLLAELDHLASEYGIKRFVFTDDIFGLKKPWLKEFCELLQGRDYIWRCNIRANTLYHDMLPDMYKAGCRVISFGFESADERVLLAISKNSVEKNEAAVKACHDAGIAVKSYMIWGFKDDDRRSAEALKAFVQTNQPDSCQIASLIPLPGTPLYREAIEGGWLPDYDQLYHNGVDGKGGMIRLPWQTDETFELRDHLLEWLADYNKEMQRLTAPWCQNKLSEPWGEGDETR